MSTQVQFIFIARNRVTMALSDRLLGLTAHESDVSRLVATDLESPELAGAA